MKDIHFDQPQIQGITRAVEAAPEGLASCRQERVSEERASEPRLYAGQADYSGADGAEANALKALAGENRRLKELLAEAMLDNTMLRDIIARNL